MAAEPPSREPAREPEAREPEAREPPPWKPATRRSSCDGSVPIAVFAVLFVALSATRPGAVPAPGAVAVAVARFPWETEGSAVSAEPGGSGRDCPASGPAADPAAPNAATPAAAASNGEESTGSGVGPEPVPPIAAADPGAVGVAAAAGGPVEREPPAGQSPEPEPVEPAPVEPDPEAPEPARPELATPEPSSSEDASPEPVSPVSAPLEWLATRGLRQVRAPATRSSSASSRGQNRGASACGQRDGRGKSPWRFSRHSSLSRSHRSAPAAARASPKLAQGLR